LMIEADVELKNKLTRLYEEDFTAYHYPLVSWMKSRTLEDCL